MTFAHVIRAVRHKRGIRSTQPDKEHEQEPDKPKRTKARLVFLQEAIVPMFPLELPAKPPRDLLKRVREALKQNSEWTNQDWDKPISRTHVKRAWKALQKP